MELNRKLKPYALQHVETLNKKTPLLHNTNFNKHTLYNEVMNT